MVCVSADYYRGQHGRKSRSTKAKRITTPHRTTPLHITKFDLCLVSLNCHMHCNLKGLKMNKTCLLESFSKFKMNTACFNLIRPLH